MFDLPPVDVQTMDTQELVPVTAKCIQESASAFNLHPDLLYALLIVEGGEVGKVTTNKNKSIDVGPAQINSIHFEELESLGISQDALKNDGCLNVYVQGWYLSKAIAGATIKTLDDYFYAIARYNSKTKSVAAAYVKKLKAAFELMYSTPPKAR